MPTKTNQIPKQAQTVAINTIRSLSEQGRKKLEKVF